MTADGNELSLQVNFLAAYLLTHELSGPLSARPGSRVVNVSSAMHRTASIAWNDLHRAKRYSRLAAYAQSQLALTVSAREKAPWTSVSVHPGICDTALLPLYAHEGDSAVEGAERVVRLCDPATEVIPGAYYDRTALSPAAPVAMEDRMVRRLCQARRPTGRQSHLKATTRKPGNPKKDVRRVVSQRARKKKARRKKKANHGKRACS